MYEASEIGIDVVMKDVVECLKIITDLNKSLQDGDWDTNEASEQTVAPVYLRSEIFKNEIKEAEMMKYKLENKVIFIYVPRDPINSFLLSLRVNMTTPNFKHLLVFKTKLLITPKRSGLKDFCLFF